MLSNPSYREFLASHQLDRHKYVQAPPLALCEAAYDPSGEPPPTMSDAQFCSLIYKFTSVPLCSALSNLSE